MFKYDYIKDHIDKNYYSEVYSNERQKIHSKIISKHFENRHKSEYKQIIFTGGCYGSGKTTLINNLHKQSKINLLDYIYIDQDLIRMYLPEYTTYLNEDSMTAGLKTNKESGYIAELVQKHAMFEGYNLIIDSSLRNGEHLCRYIKWIQTLFPSYEIIIIFAKTSLETVVKRNNQRKSLGCRSTDTHIINEVYYQSLNSLEMLTPLVNKVLIYDTEQL